MGNYTFKVAKVVTFVSFSLSIELILHLSTCFIFRMWLTDWLSSS